MKSKSVNPHHRQKGATGDKAPCLNADSWASILCSRHPAFATDFFRKDCTGDQEDLKRFGGTSSGSYFTFPSDTTSSIQSRRETRANKKNAGQVLFREIVIVGEFPL